MIAKELTLPPPFPNLAGWPKPPAPSPGRTLTLSGEKNPASARSALPSPLKSPNVIALGDSSGTLAARLKLGDEQVSAARADAV
jgi:hypothetical protein